MRFSEYNIKDGILMKMEKVDPDSANGQPTNNKIFKIEKEMSVEEKFNFLNGYDDGGTQSMYDLILKWEAEKNTLPQDVTGNPKTVSTIAWLKRNASDDFPWIDISDNYGSYVYFGRVYGELSSTCPNNDSFHGREYVWSNTNIINQWFHDLLCTLLFFEIEHDNHRIDRNIKIRKLLSMIEKHGTLGSSYVREHHVNVSKLSNETIEELLDVYERVEKIVSKIDKKLGGNK